MALPIRWCHRAWCEPTAGCSDAGLDVEMKTYPTNHRLHPDMLGDVNRWIIGQLTAENPGPAAAEL